MITVRAEEKAIMIWDSEKAGTAYISGAELDVLSRWASQGIVTGFVNRLLTIGVINDESKQSILSAINESVDKKAPLRSFCAPESLHIELTTKCDLHCPQCYKSGAQTVDLPLTKAKDIIKQAAELKVFQIAIGGGEPLLYPWLLDILKAIQETNMSSTITTSGDGLDGKLLDELIAAGLKHMQISLNGSTAEIHNLSRDMYTSGVNALKLLMGRNISYGVNWVARRDNIADLPNYINLVKSLGGKNINILRYKPSSNESYDKLKLTDEQSLFLKQTVKDTKGLGIKLDSAYSNLLCSVNDKAVIFGGCGAGRRFIAVDAEGRFRPCSHLSFRESVESLSSYWYDSGDLKQFRELDDKISEPCKSCEYLSGCRGCRAVTLHEYGDFYHGESFCTFYKRDEN